MFKKLEAYFSNKQVELEKNFSGATLLGLEKAVFNAKEEFQEHANKMLYSDSKLIQRQIDYLLLQELYCGQLTNIDKKVTALVTLEQSYEKLKHMLVQARHQELQSTISSMTARAKRIEQEIDLQKPDDKDITSKDFVEIMALVKEKHHTASVNQANCSYTYNSKQLAALSEEVRAIQDNLSDAIAENYAAIEAKKNQPPLGRLEQWALEDHYGRANPLKQLVLWLYNRFSDIPLQTTASERQTTLSNIDLKMSMSSARISNLNSSLEQKQVEIRRVDEAVQNSTRRQKSLEAVKHSATTEPTNNTSEDYETFKVK